MRGKSHAIGIADNRRAVRRKAKLNAQHEMFSCGGTYKRFHGTNESYYFVLRI